MKELQDYKVSYTNGQTIIIRAYNSTQAAREAARVTGQRVASAKSMAKPDGPKK